MKFIAITILYFCQSYNTLPTAPYCLNTDYIKYSHFRSSRKMSPHKFTLCREANPTSDHHIKYVGCNKYPRIGCELTFKDGKVVQTSQVCTNFKTVSF